MDQNLRDIDRFISNSEVSWRPTLAFPPLHLFFPGASKFIKCLITEVLIIWSFYNLFFQWGGKDLPLWYMVYRITSAVLLPIWVTMDCIMEYKEFYPKQPGKTSCLANNMFSHMTHETDNFIKTQNCTRHFCWLHFP